MKIGIILGSNRPGRNGLAVFEWLEQAIPAIKPELEFDFIDLKEVDLPFLDEEAMPSSQNYTHEHTKAWSARIEACDGYIFVTPEYNYTFPAVLKNAIDYLYLEWQRKPVGFVGYGGRGAGASVQALRAFLGTIDLADISNTVSINLFDDLHDGRWQAGDKYAESLHRMLDALEWWAKALAAARK